MVQCSQGPWTEADEPPASDSMPQSLAIECDAVDSASDTP